MKLIASTALAVLLACPALAAPNCAATEDVIAILFEKYGEEVVTEGVNKRGLLISWWGNPDTGSWSITATKDGVTCILDEGDKFRRIALTPNV